MESLELREITPEVLGELRAHVVLPPHQAEWVGGSVDDSLLEAAELPEGKPWPRGVYRDGVPVGFVMLAGTSSRTRRASTGRGSCGS